MNVHMQLRTVTFRRDNGFNLKPEVSRWLDHHGCYDGPDLFFVDDPKDARPFAHWDNVNDEWAVFYFNHEDMSRKFLEEFASWDPTFDIEVKHKVRTTSRSSLNDVYGALYEEFMWLAQHGKIDGVDFRWTITQLSEEHFNPNITDTSLIFAFRDKQLAMTFKLMFGGVRVQIA